MRKFKELKFVTYNHSNELQLNMIIPGVNSGVYTPSLHIICKIIEKKGICKRKSTSSMTLSINDVKELRDECNLILEEAVYQRRLNKEKDEA